MENDFSLLQLLFEAGLGFTGLGFELAFKLRLAATQLLLRLGFHFAGANLGVALPFFFMGAKSATN